MTSARHLEEKVAGRCRFQVDSARLKTKNLLSLGREALYNRASTGSCCRE